MKNNPKVTVICLCYNHGKYVQESLQSVVEQSYKNIELIIADDCSSDDSVKNIENWLLKYPEVKFIKNKKNIGNIKTFNAIFNSTNGDYILDLAADDLLLPDFLTLLISKFNSSNFENLGAVFGNCILIDENNRQLDTFYETNSDGTLIKKPAVGNVYTEILKGGKESMCAVSTLFKREVFEKLNGYDETLHYEDLDFWIRASRIYNFDFIENCIIKKRVLGKSLGSTFHKKKNELSEKLNSSTLKIIKKVLLLNKTKQEDKAILNRIHYEFINNFKILNIKFTLSYLFYILKVRFRILFSKYYFPKIE